MVSRAARASSRRVTSGGQNARHTRMDRSGCATNGCGRARRRTHNPCEYSDVKPFIYSQRENRRILPEILEVKEDSATNRCVLEYSRPWFSACLDASRFVTPRKKNRWKMAVDCIPL